MTPWNTCWAAKLGVVLETGVSWRLSWVPLLSYSPCLLLLPKRAKSVTKAKNGGQGSPCTSFRDRVEESALGYLGKLTRMSPHLKGEWKFAKQTRKRMVLHGKESAWTKTPSYEQIKCSTAEELLKGQYGGRVKHYLQRKNFFRIQSWPELTAEK